MSEASAQVRIYDPSTSVVFLKTNEKFGGLSNMAPGYPLEVNGIAIRTSEALYQALRFPHMPDLQRVIIDEASPMTAKMRTKPHRENSREDWDRVRVKIMRWCLQVKLAQNVDAFGKLLLSTGEAPIVEFSKKDQFWGAEPGEDGRLVGMNVLGRLLMELREQFRSNGPEWVAKVDPLPIDHFDLLSRHIEPVFARWARSAEKASEARSASKRVPRDDLFSALAAPSFSGERAMADPVAPQVLNLPRYPEMRDTGLAWLPRAPAHWPVLRIKNVLREFDRKSKTGEERLLTLRMQAGLIDHERAGGKAIPPQALIGYRHVYAGDLVMNRMRASTGLFGIAPTEGLVSPDYATFHPIGDVDPTYLVYLFKTSAMGAVFRAESKGLGTGESGFLRLYTDRFNTIRITVPPLDEQRAIVRFLDWHGSLTAKLIRAKRRLIALLNEQKQAIVHRAVTRGLDPNARLVPSGVPWLGDIPEGWRTAPAMLLFDEKLIRNKGMIEKTVLSLSYGRLVVKPEERLRGLVPESFETYQVVEPGEIIVRTTDLQNDQKSLRVGLCATRGIITSAYLCLKPRSSLTSEFAYLVLHSYDVSKLFYSLGSGVRQNLGFNDIKRVPFPVPPVEQQQQLCEAVARATRDINQAIDQSTRELSLLEELRARLVADAVTGQLDVRAVAATLPETGAPELGSEVADADEELDPDAESDVEEAA
ncbi:MAG TPA: NADAR domain-containing protein [Caulobacterales bacterium]|nr:NADAR domain-containing protein [Caulobacterales bacterium]